MMSPQVINSISRWLVYPVLIGWLSLFSVSPADSLGQEVNAEQESKLSDDDLAMDPKFIDAYHKLDETLKYEPRKSAMIRSRLIVVGFFGGLLLTFLGLLFIYLRLDHATRGFYSGRLLSLGIGIFVLILVGSYLLWTKFLF